MKSLTATFLACIALVALVTSCTAKHEVETSRLTEGLRDAAQDVQDIGAAAMVSINAENYEEAVDILAKLKEKELSDEAKQAVADVLVDIQNLMTQKGATPEQLEKTQNLMMEFM